MRLHVAKPRESLLTKFFLATSAAENTRKRHIYLHTLTFNALSCNGIDEYNTLVISNL